MEGRTGGRTDGRTDGWTGPDGCGRMWTDWTGADGRTDGRIRTDGRTDGRTSRVVHSASCKSGSHNLRLGSLVIILFLALTTRKRRSPIRSVSLPSLPTPARSVSCCATPDSCAIRVADCAIRDSDCSASRSPDGWMSGCGCNPSEAEPTHTEFLKLIIFAYSTERCVGI